MKKLLPFLLLLSLLLCACSSAGGSIAPLPGAADPTVAPSQEPAPQITSEPAPAPAATPEPVVIYDAYCKIGSYDDSLSNHWDYVLRIPAIQAPG